MPPRQSRDSLDGLEREGGQPLLDTELPTPSPHARDVEASPVELVKDGSVGHVLRPTRDELEDEEVLGCGDGQLDPEYEDASPPLQSVDLERGDREEEVDDDGLVGATDSPQPDGLALLQRARQVSAGDLETSGRQGVANPIGAGGYFGEMTLFDGAPAGSINPDTRTPLSRVGIGAITREGAPVPDVSTPEAFKRTLLAARSIVHGDPATPNQSGVVTMRILTKAGILDAIKPKARVAALADGFALVAKGEVEVALFNLVEFPSGVRLAGHREFFARRPEAARSVASRGAARRRDRPSWPGARAGSKPGPPRRRAER
jgi:hypothetical protein